MRRAPAIRGRSATPRRSDFYGVDQDADAFARAIMRYVTKFDRWDSPKFLFGESYGTTRSGALAYQLQERGLALNGVVLLSSIMNYGRRQPGLDRDYLNYLPSYAATAWYHHKMAEPARDRRAGGGAGARFRRRALCLGAREGPDASAREERDRRRAADERADRALSPTSSSAPTCASTCRASARSCCATSG